MTKRLCKSFFKLRNASFSFGLRLNKAISETFLYQFFKQIDVHDSKYKSTTICHGKHFVNKNKCLTMAECFVVMNQLRALTFCFYVSLPSILCWIHSHKSTKTLQILFCLHWNFRCYVLAMFHNLKEKYQKAAWIFHSQMRCGNLMWDQNMNHTHDITSCKNTLSVFLFSCLSSVFSLFFRIETRESVKWTANGTFTLPEELFHVKIVGEIFFFQNLLAFFCVLACGIWFSPSFNVSDCLNDR